MCTALVGVDTTKLDPKLAPEIGLVVRREVAAVVVQAVLVAAAALGAQLEGVHVSTRKA